MNIKQTLNALQQKYNNYKKIHGNTKLLDNTGFFKNGKVIDESTFERRYRRRINYGLAVAEDIISPEFELNKIQTLKNSIETMLVNMGNSVLVQQINSMTLQQFQEEYEAGFFNDIIELYDDYTSVELIEILVGKSNALRQKKYRLRKKVKRLLGYE